MFIYDSKSLIYGNFYIFLNIFFYFIDKLQFFITMYMLMLSNQKAVSLENIINIKVIVGIFAAVQLIGSVLYVILYYFLTKKANILMNLSNKIRIFCMGKTAKRIRFAV